MKQYIITTGGEQIEVAPVKGEQFTLKELQDIVGGYIQLLYLPHGSIMVINEEGKVHGLPYNEVATIALGGSDYEGEYVVGRVLICDFKSIN